MNCTCDCPNTIDTPVVMSQQAWEARHYKGAAPDPARWQLGIVLDNAETGETAIGIETEEGKHAWMIRGPGSPIKVVLP